MNPGLAAGLHPKREAKAPTGCTDQPNGHKQHLVARGPVDMLWCRSPR